ncbi:MAG: methionyl-tRNA formyltransferase [Phycisphaerae bacterium]|nr:methionyl-tRNA formyltransferase [Phycisphaerae bacterium]
MQVIFCGSGDFALPSFQAVVAAGYDVTAVVTPPARKAGRGGKLQSTPVAIAAREANLELHETANINSPESVAYLKSRGADAICVIEFGQLVKKPVRDIAKIDAFNLHGSLLPQLRGAGPVNWAIINGLTETGVTSFSLVDKMDAGDVYIKSRAIKIGETMRSDELRATLAQLGAEVVLETLALLESGKAVPEPQDDAKATLAPKLKKSDGFVDFTAPAEQITRLVRGAWNWPGAQADFRRADGKIIPVTIANARTVEIHSYNGDGCADKTPGSIDGDLYIQTGAGRIEILEIKPAGKRLMLWDDFVNGYRVHTGDAFLSRDANGK